MKFNPCKPCCTPCGHNVAVGIYWSGNGCSKRDTPVGGIFINNVLYPIGPSLGPRIVRVKDGEVISPGGLGKPFSFVSEIGVDYDITLVGPGLPPPPPPPDPNYAGIQVPYTPYESTSAFGVYTDPIWCVQDGDTVRYTGKCLKQNQTDLVRLYADHSPGCFNIEKKDYTATFYFFSVEQSGSIVQSWWTPSLATYAGGTSYYRNTMSDVNISTGLTKTYTLKFIDQGASPGFCGYWDSGLVDNYAKDGYTNTYGCTINDQIYHDCKPHGCTDMTMKPNPQISLSFDIGRGTLNPGLELPTLSVYQVNPLYIRWGAPNPNPNALDPANYALWTVIQNSFGGGGCYSWQTTATSDKTYYLYMVTLS